jgi:hypothetical protein
MQPDACAARAGWTVDGAAISLVGLDRHCKLVLWVHRAAGMTGTRTLCATRKKTFAFDWRQRRGRAPGEQGVCGRASALSRGSGSLAPLLADALAPHTPSSHALHGTRRLPPRHEAAPRAQPAALLAPAAHPPADPSRAARRSSRLPTLSFFFFLRGPAGAAPHLLGTHSKAT